MKRKDFPLIAGAASEMADCCMGKDMGWQAPPEGLVYLDNAATMQKPRQVLAAVDRYYRTCSANPLRGMYDLSVAAGEQVATARAKVAKFIGAKSSEEIVFCSGATEGLNMVAGWCEPQLSSDDEILLSFGEHHSNILPWAMISQKTGASLSMARCKLDGTIIVEDFENNLNPNVQVVSISYIGNVLGGENRIKKLFKKAHEMGAICILDMAQAVAHRKVNVRDLDADIAVFSGHKMGAPMGIGVIYAKKHILEMAVPSKLGGGAVDTVQVTPLGIKMIYPAAGGPQKFEAGTLNVGGIVGLGAAIDYLEEVGLERIAKYERELTDYALEKLDAVARVYGGNNGMIAFNVPGVHPHDVAQILNSEGIAVRAGWHCAQPLLEHLHIGPVVRASLSFYNTKGEIDKLARVLKTVPGKMGVENV